MKKTFKKLLTIKKKETVKEIKTFHSIAIRVDEIGKKRLII